MWLLAAGCGSAFVVLLGFIDWIARGEFAIGPSMVVSAFAGVIKVEVGLTLRERPMQTLSEIAAATLLLTFLARMIERARAEHGLRLRMHAAQLRIARCRASLGHVKPHKTLSPLAAGAR